MTEKFIMIASSKGGVGKSTAALGLSFALSSMGHKVLLCDLDFGNACLDMLLGVEDSVMCTVQDVALGRSSCEAALVKAQAVAGGKRKKRAAKTTEGQLWLLPSVSGGHLCKAGFGGEDFGFDADSVAKAVRDAAEFVGAEFVILDTGAGVNSAVGVAAALADTAVIVTGQMPVALRSAEATAGRIREMGVDDIRLLVNSFDSAGVREGRCGLLSAIDQSRSPLLGVVPYDYGLMLSHERLLGKTAESSVAFSNIARRIKGESIPLFSGIKSLRKLKNKICL